MKGRMKNMSREEMMAKMKDKMSKMGSREDFMAKLKGKMGNREEMMAKIKERMAAARDRAKAKRGSGIADTGPDNIPPRRTPPQKWSDRPLPKGMAMKYDRMKERFPSYSWGTAPTTIGQFKDMRRDFRDWRKAQPKPGAPVTGMKAGGMVRGSGCAQRGRTKGKMV